MKHTWRSHVRWTTLLAVLALLLSACGGGDDGGEAAGGGSGEGGEAAGLEGAEFSVGSKEFTEQLILGAMTIQLLEDAGASVDDQTGLVCSSVVREALTGGDIDMYWEYKGTGWITHLGNTEPIPDEQEQFEAVRDADAENGLTWLDPAPLNNTYAIAANAETAEETGIETLSDFSEYVQANQSEATLCAAAEFLGRDDGYPGLEEAYGFTIPPDQISELELGIVYESVGNGDPCVFGEVFTTDGRIQSQNLTVFEDDQAFFPKYNASLVVSTEVLEQYPELEELFAPLTEALTNDVMIELNARVDVEGEQPEDVATDFLTEQGLIGG
jgi:osmoprotectant transport system substrate-binding protein